MIRTTGSSGSRYRWQRNLSPEQIARNRAWFDAYVQKIRTTPQALPLRCPCCFCKTLSERGAFEICDVCFWEDDGQDDYDADIVRGGPNNVLSLTQARGNYQKFGACDDYCRQLVRPPKPEELAAGCEG